MRCIHGEEGEVATRASVLFIALVGGDASPGPAALRRMTKKAA